jgi:hypothetical protein
MSESVSVEHGGVTITTNTASEADLRTEMEAPPEAPPSTDAAAAPVRDPRGRFAKTESATPLAEAAPPPEPATDTEPPARGGPAARDATLPRHNPIARLNQALAQKAEAERKAAALEAELTRYRQPAPVTGQVTPQPQPSTNPTNPRNSTNGHEPQFDQFADAADPYTAYLQAWTRWDREQGIAQALAEREAAHAAQTRAQAFQTRLTDGRTQYPDFDTVLANADTLGLQVSAVMQEAIANSPRAADLVYFLATHPEECTQLAEESVGTPVAAATVMQRLLESQAAPRAAPAKAGSGPAARASVSTANPPVTPVGSSPVASDEPPGDTASAAEHARYWNRRLKVPGTR